MRKFYMFTSCLILFVCVFCVKSFALTPAVQNQQYNILNSSQKLSMYDYLNGPSNNIQYGEVTDYTHFDNWYSGTFTASAGLELSYDSLVSAYFVLVNQGFPVTLDITSNLCRIRAVGNVYYNNVTEFEIPITLSNGFTFYISPDWATAYLINGYYYASPDGKYYYAQLDENSIIFGNIETYLNNIQGRLLYNGNSISKYVYDISVDLTRVISSLTRVESYVDGLEGQLSTLNSNTSATGPIVQAINNMSTNIVNAISQKNLSVDLGNVEVDASSIQFSFDQIIPYLRSLVASTDFGSISADYFFTRNSVPLVNLYGRQYYYQGAKNKYFDQYIYNADLYYIEYTTYGQTVSDMLYDSTTGSYIESITGYSTPQNWYLRVYKLPQNHQFRIWTDFNYHYPLYCGPSWLLPKEYADLLGSDFSYFSKLNSIDTHIQSISIPNYSTQLQQIIQAIGNIDLDIPEQEEPWHDFESVENLEYVSSVINSYVETANNTLVHYVDNMSSRSWRVIRLADDLFGVSASDLDDSIDVMYNYFTPNGDNYIFGLFESDEMTGGGAEVA